MNAPLLEESDVGDGNSLILKAGDVDCTYNHSAYLEDENLSCCAVQLSYATTETHISWGTLKATR